MLDHQSRLANHRVASGKLLIEPAPDDHLDELIAACLAISLVGGALLSVLTAADGYIVIPEEATGLDAGREVDVILYA